MSGILDKFSRVTKFGFYFCCCSEETRTVKVFLLEIKEQAVT